MQGKQYHLPTRTVRTTPKSLWTRTFFSLTASFMFGCRVAPDFTLLQPFTVDFANVQQGKELGTGAFATVYEAIYTPYQYDR